MLDAAKGKRLAKRILANEFDLTQITIADLKDLAHAALMGAPRPSNRLRPPQPQSKLDIVSSGTEGRISFEVHQTPGRRRSVRSLCYEVDDETSAPQSAVDGKSSQS